MNAEFGLRAGRSEDLRSVQRLVGSMTDAPRWPQSVWSELLVNGAQRPVERSLLLAERMTAPDGSTIVGLTVTSCVANVADLETVIVAEFCRRRGVGRLLCRAAMQWAQTQGAAEMQLEVRASNAAAIALYRELGFTEVGRRLRYYCYPTEDAVLMNVRVPPGSKCAR